MRPHNNAIANIKNLIWEALQWGVRTLSNAIFRGFWGGSKFEKVYSFYDIVESDFFFLWLSQ